MTWSPHRPCFNIGIGKDVLPQTRLIFECIDVTHLTLHPYVQSDDARSSTIRLPIKVALAAQLPGCSVVFEVNISADAVAAC